MHGWENFCVLHMYYRLNRLLGSQVIMCDLRAADLGSIPAAPVGPFCRLNHTRDL